MNLKNLYAAAAFGTLLSLQVAAHADYLAPDPSQNGSASDGSVSSSSALTTKNADSDAPAVMVDNSDAGWSWNNMVEYADPDLYEKSGYAGGPGSYGVYNFHGTGIEITGMGGPSVTLDGVKHTMGSIEVFIDGKQVALNSVHLYNVKYRDSIFKVDGLDKTNHVLHIEPIGGWIVVNYITILNSPTDGSLPTNTDTQDASTSNSNLPGYRLSISNSTNMCLDVPPGDLNGAKIDIWSNDPGRNQIWTFNPVGPNTYTMSPAGHPNEVLWIEPSSPGNPQPSAFLWHYTGAPNEILTISGRLGGSGKQSCTISGQGQNLALTVPNVDFYNGLNVSSGVLWGTVGTQSFIVQKVGN